VAGDRGRKASEPRDHVLGRRELAGELPGVEVGSKGRCRPDRVRALRRHGYPRVGVDLD